MGTIWAKESGKKARHKEKSLWEDPSLLCFINTFMDPGVPVAGRHSI